MDLFYLHIIKYTTVIDLWVFFWKSVMIPVDLFINCSVTHVQRLLLSCRGHHAASTLQQGARKHVTLNRK